MKGGNEGRVRGVFVGFRRLLEGVFGLCFCRFRVIFCFFWIYCFYNVLCVVSWRKFIRGEVIDYFRKDRKKS